MRASVVTHDGEAPLRLYRPDQRTPPDVFLRALRNHVQRHHRRRLRRLPTLQGERGHLDPPPLPPLRTFGPESRRAPAETRRHGLAARPGREITNTLPM